MKNFTLLIVLLFFAQFSWAQTARVQVIHNSADAAADSVDVYLNDGLLINNFAFRNASSYIDAPAGSPVSIDIAPKNSTSSSESIFNLTTTLTAGETYVLIASGIVSMSGYLPATPFGISVNAMGREMAATNTNTDLLVFHGSTDAPTVDVYEATGNANLVDNIEYGNFAANYLELPTDDYYLQVRDMTGATNIFAYNAPLETLQLEGGAGVVVASGFVDPSVNSDGESFGLYVALPTGGEMVALPQTTTRVQVIHNSADKAADSVDVYLNGDLLINDFAFRNASAYIDAPANTEVSIDIAPKTSSAATESIYNLKATLSPVNSYVLVASGIISPSGYSPATPFGISVNAMGREMASTNTNTDLLVYHGSTDAPTVDVYEATGNGNLVDNIDYGDFAANYLELPTDDYYLQVRDMTGATNIFAYNAPLETLQLEGGAGVVVASGFVDPSVNSDGEGFGLYVALPTGGEMVALPQTTTRVQVVHNSADKAADSVDVYLNGDLLINDFAFRNASAFIDAPANTEVSIDIAPKTSSAATESIYNLKATLSPMNSYVLVASGIVSPSGYSPATPFGISVNAMGREMASTNTNTDLLVYHGSTDAPTVDVYEATGNANLVDNIAYGNFSANYLKLPTDDYYLQVRDMTGVTNIFAYNAPLETLQLEGGAGVVVASGFVDPSVNSDGESFGLYVALPTGGEMVALPQTTTRVQVIHNSADKAADTVDVYLNGDLLINDFAFRNASAYIDAPANTEVSIDIAPKTSSAATESIYNLKATLSPMNSYVLVASGIVSPSGYSPATPFGISVNAMGREMASTNTNTDLLVYHGSTDAPTVDVYEATGNGNLVDNIAYGNFSANYLELPTDDYYLQVRDMTGATNIFAYNAPLETLQLEGGAGVVVASGFVDPSVNSDGESFGLYVALPTGGEMVTLPQTTTRVQVIHNSADKAAETVDVYLNGDLLINDFAFRNASAYIDAPANTEVSIDIAPKTSSAATESIYNLKATLSPIKKYVLIASGIVSTSGYSPTTAFAIHINDMAREVAKEMGKTDLLVYHGSTDAPKVDVFESTNSAMLIDDLEYSKFAEYLELATDDYIIGVRDQTGATVVARYQAPLSSLSLDNQAITVVASGFLTPDNNSNGAAFGLWVALADGGKLVELPASNYSSTQSISDNSTSEARIYPNPASSDITIELDREINSLVRVNILTLTGSNVYSNIKAIDGGSMNLSLESLKPGLYFLQLHNSDFSYTIRFEKL